MYPYFIVLSDSLHGALAHLLVNKFFKVYIGCIPLMNVLVIRWHLIGELPRITTDYWSLRSDACGAQPVS